jgi:predicted transposase YdaD
MKHDALTFMLYSQSSLQREIYSTELLLLDGLKGGREKGRKEGRTEGRKEGGEKLGEGDRWRCTRVCMYLISQHYT